MKPGMYEEMLKELQRVSRLLQALSVGGLPGLAKDYERVQALIAKANG